MNLNHPANSCRICSNPQLEIIKSIRTPDTSNKFSVVRCLNCGIIYIDPFPTINQTTELYEKNLLNNSQYYDLHHEEDLVSFNQRMDLLEKYSKELLEKYPEVLPEKDQKLLLDYGCSTGNFLEVALNRGYQAEGIELNKNSVEICKKKGQRVNNLSQKEYDLVHAGDVIEHVHEPMDFLREIYSLLKKQGILILSTPDWGKWITRKTQVKPEEHLFYFTKKTLKAIVERSGFEILYLQNCSRRRSIHSLLLSSTSQNEKISAALKVLNLLHLGRSINFILSHLNDDLLLIARKW
ncbi:class I SAM-dependent methyltransferase [Candidatus Woesearchaeota archaeon]|nr:class I SAM-dependent methyltransferase [Candidatus Woesearchaeota archaeon]